MGVNLLCVLTVRIMGLGKLKLLRDVTQMVSEEGFA
jgi:hypothetical protein